VQSHRLRVLVLNTNVYAPVNCPLGAASCGDDPLGQFGWLEEQFEQAAANDEMVHIHGHIPPAIDSYSRRPQWSESFCTRYWQTLETHAETLACHFFGHWHSAEVRVSPPPLIPSLSSSSTTPTSTIALQAAPALQVLSSVSPIFAGFPAFYSAHVDAQTRLVIPSHFTQYALDLTTVAGEYPSFVASPRATPARGLSNDEYRALFAAWLDKTDPDADRSFTRFYDQYKAGYHGKGLKCNTTDAVFQDCRECTGDCRVAFACLQLSGCFVREYEQCLAQRRSQAQRSNAQNIWRNAGTGGD